MSMTVKPAKVIFLKIYQFLIIGLPIWEYIYSNTMAERDVVPY